MLNVLFGFKITIFNGLAHGFLGIPERHSTFDEFVQGIHTKEVIVFGVVQNLGVHFNFLQTKGHQFQTGLHVLQGRNDHFLHQLQITAVASSSFFFKSLLLNFL